VGKIMTKPQAIKYIDSIQSFKTEVYRCFRCRGWYARAPVGALGADHSQCERCGCTSFSIDPGRPIGRKSKWWDIWHAEILSWIEADAIEYEDRKIHFIFKK